jgi:uncharacterized protein YbjT (DUF2867 family)
MPTVLVTGATGNAGREVVAALQRLGVRTRAGVRNEASGTEADEAARLDFYDPATFAPALAGCDAVFLLRPPPISDTRSTLNRMVDEARRQGVRRIVFLSVAGAEGNRLVPHHAVEQHLISGPPDWTILRPGFFAQNVGTAYRQDVLEDGRLYVPAGSGRVAFVDLRDLGEVAAKALVDDAHRGHAYTLTGPRAFTFYEVAEALTEATGRRVRYDPASIVGYAVHLLRRGMPLMQVLVQTVLHVGLRFGQAEGVDPTLERLLGRPPRSVLDYIADHAALWQPAHSSPDR